MQKKPKKAMFFLIFSIFILFVLLAACKSSQAAPIPSPTATIEAAPSQTKEPINVAQLIEELKTRLPEGFFPVYKDNKPVAFIPFKEKYAAVFLCTKDRKLSYELLSAKNRIYDTEDNISFFVMWLENNNPVHRINLGQYPVLYGMKEKIITKDAKMYIFSFLTSKKKIDAIVSISQKAPPTVNFFDTNPQKSTDIDDYNNDGIPDILVRENLFEQGTGKETFLYLYKWNGHDFEISHSLAILRSLNNFFYQTTVELQRGDVESFYNRAVEGRPDSIWQVFIPEGTSPPIKADKIMLTFPSLVENPFPDNAKPLSTVRIPVKVETKEKTFIAYSTIKINQFPFTIRPFSFVIDRKAP